MKKTNSEVNCPAERFYDELGGKSNYARGKIRQHWMGILKKIRNSEHRAITLDLHRSTLDPMNCKIAIDNCQMHRGHTDIGDLKQQLLNQMYFQHTDEFATVKRLRTIQTIIMSMNCGLTMTKSINFVCEFFLSFKCCPRNNIVWLYCKIQYNSRIVEICLLFAVFPLKIPYNYTHEP